MQESERVAEEAMASTDAERPREVRRTCTVLDLAFPDVPDKRDAFHQTSMGRHERGPNTYRGK